MSGLDALAGEAAAVDREANGEPGPGGQPGAPPADEKKTSTEAQLNTALALVIDKAGDKFPSVKPVWDDGKRAMFCGALAPVLDKYDVDAFGFFEEWHVEIMAVVICVPLLWLTAKAIRADLDAAAQSREKEINPASGTGGYDPHAPPTRGVNDDGVPKS